MISGQPNSNNPWNIQQLRDLAKMGGYIFPFNHVFSRASRLKPFTPSLYNPIRRYSEARKAQERPRTEKEERAPSTAEVMKRVAEEKLRAAEQGTASQTSDKAFDAADEATLEGSNLDSIKRRHKDHEPGVDYRRRGDDHN